MNPLRVSLEWSRSTWRRLRPWRRLRFTRAGVVFTLGSLAVGFAAVNTGNNLLFLLLGAMLGAMAVSGWLSERTLRRIEVTRRLPGGIPVGRDFRIRYTVTNRKRRLASFALELQEEGLAALAFVPRVGPGESVTAPAAGRFVRRGVYPLETLTLATEFPFGLFRKERDIRIPGEVVVWPRTDRQVPEAVSGGDGFLAALAVASRASAGARGEFRSLRDYRIGDDARDIHWRTSARLRRPVIREYEGEAGDPLWIVLDVAQPPGEAAERSLEVAAALCAGSARLRRPFALAAGPWRVQPGSGETHLERALDALARVDFGDPAGDAPEVDRERAVLVTGQGMAPAGYGEVIPVPAVPSSPRTRKAS